MTYPVGQPQNVQLPNYSGVNIQIFNPSVFSPDGKTPINTTTQTIQPAPPAVHNAYPQNYYTQNFNNTAQGQKATDAQQVNPQSQPQAEPEKAEDKKKTEKRKVVELTDSYIKTLENYLNDPNDPQVRLMGAKEVVERLQEDDSRSNDIALNALINKMLQDPSTPVRALALGALNTRIASGDELTVMILQHMQNQKEAYGQDAIEASQALLKLSGQTVEREFEVKNQHKNTDKK